MWLFHLPIPTELKTESTQVCKFLDNISNSCLKVAGGIGETRAAAQQKLLRFSRTSCSTAPVIYTTEYYWETFPATCIDFLRPSLSSTFGGKQVGLGVGLRSRSMQTEGLRRERERERDACNVFTLGISVNGSCKEKEQGGGHARHYTWHVPP